MLNFLVKNSKAFLPVRGPCHVIKISDSLFFLVINERGDCPITQTENITKIENQCIKYIFASIIEKIIDE